MSEHVRNFRTDRAPITVWTPWGLQPGRRSAPVGPGEPVTRIEELRLRLKARRRARAKEHGDAVSR